MGFAMIFVLALKGIWYGIYIWLAYLTFSQRSAPWTNFNKKTVFPGVFIPASRYLQPYNGKPFHSKTASMKQCKYIGESIYQNSNKQSSNLLTTACVLCTTEKVLALIRLQIAKLRKLWNVSITGTATFCFDSYRMPLNTLPRCCFPWYDTQQDISNFPDVVLPSNVIDSKAVSIFRDNLDWMGQRNLLFFVIQLQTDADWLLTINVMKYIRFPRCFLLEMV